MRTTSTCVLEAEITPYRLLCRRKCNHARAKHVRPRILKSRPLSTVQDRMTKKYQVGKEFKTYIPEKDNWKLINKTIGATVMHCYKKDSGIKDGTEPVSMGWTKTSGTFWYRNILPRFFKQRF